MDFQRDPELKGLPARRSGVLGRQLAGPEAGGGMHEQCGRSWSLRSPRLRAHSAPRARMLAAIAGLAFGSAALAQQQPGQSPGEPLPGQPQVATPGEVGAPVAPGEQAPTGDPEKPAYQVGVFLVEFEKVHPGYPSIEDLLQATVTLGRTDDGFVAPGPGVEIVTIPLIDVPLMPAARYSSRALAAVARALVDEMNAFGIIGVTVSPSESEFAPPEDDDPDWGKDLRRPGQTSLTLIIRTGIVSEVRTLASGERIPYEQRINNPAHARIRDNAPVLPYSPDDQSRRDLLRKDLLDQYVFRLNRHPGRRVDLAVAAGAEPGTIALDFLITENKPWLAYFQVSNTGTESTSEWRERFGYINNQLTGNDDILSLDYVTAGFDSSHAFVGSYDFPIVGDWWRLRPFASWSMYEASDVGFAGEEFEGENWSLGAETTVNFYQNAETFIDFFAGVRYERVEVANNAVDIEGRNNFLITSLGLRYDRSTEIASTRAEVGFEFNLPDVADTDPDELDALGRLDPDDSWLAMQWDFSHSLYLEPLLFRDRWENTGPGGMPTLAHEMVFAFRGQYTFSESRLVPNYEQVVGGLYTVRGYDESIVAGDTVVVASAEYRFHLPQALAYDPNPGELWGKPFRYRPQQPYGRADWDLILKGFFDIGRTVNNDRKSFESDETLIGTGVGIEFLYRRNLTLRLDWGFVLDEIEGRAEVGDNRLHFVGTILF
jgi:hemolysin activation/secretion protein